MVLGIKDTTQGKMEDYFKQFGEVEDAVVLNDVTSGKPKGFGFLVFKEYEAAQ